MDPKNVPGGGLDSTKIPNLSTENSKNTTTNADQSHKTYPKFLVISSESGQLAKTSPFIIQKGLLGIGGNPKSVKKLRSGDLLIETCNPLQSKSFLAGKTIHNIPISVTPHNSLNSCRGVISENDLVHVTEKEILEELQEQNVSQVRRITIKRGEEIINTKHIILTFNSPKLPTHIIAGYLNCPVRPYIPNPLRCFNCQRFGHSTATCRSSETCSRCSAVGHSFSSCDLPYKCLNCNGNHSANFKGCPKWKEEKEIQTIRATQQLSYTDARKLVSNRLPTPNLSYAAAAKKTTSSIAIQCDISKDTPLKTNNPPSNANISSSSIASNETKNTKASNFVTPLTILSKSVKSKKEQVEINQSKKPKLKERTKISHNIPSDLSDSGEMEVENGMDAPSNLQPKGKPPKQHTTPISFP